jgi:hypothetical protein
MELVPHVATPVAPRVATPVAPDVAAALAALAAVVPPLAPRLAAAASRQGGLFTAGQAIGAGYDRAEIRHLVRTRAWTRLRRGVYLPTTLMPDDGRARHVVAVRAVLLKLGAPGIASHISAIAVHDIATFEPDWSTVHVTRTGLPASRHEAGVHHHAGRIAPQQATMVAGVPVTSVAWSLVDHCRTSTLEGGLVSVESALWARRVTSAELLAVHRGCADWPGARMAGRVISFASARSETPGETLARVAFERHGLPDPEQQVELRDGRGFVGRVDFLWRSRRTIGEFDGRVKYEGGSGVIDTLYAEKLREDRLRTLGFEVVRFGYADVAAGSGAGLAARVRAAFERAAARRPA